MKSVKTKIAQLLLFSPLYLWSQETLLIGQIRANSDLENIHVINISSNKFTTTNRVGAFQITAKLNDTIRITAIKYIPKEIIISVHNLSTKILQIELKELINILDEVIVGTVLTGDIDSDIKNSKAEAPINFYDVGIPGYTGPKKTQAQRRLYEATTGFGFIPLNPIINAITGRTKRLKKHVKDEQNNKLILSIKDRLATDFFANNPLPEDRQMEFLYFASENPDFEVRCKNTSDIQIIIYLEEKYKIYKQNLTVSND